MSDNVIPFRVDARMPEQTQLPPIPERPFDTKLLRSAVSLLRVGACAFAEGNTPFFTDTTLKDVQEVVRQAREHIGQWREVFDCNASGDIDIAAAVLSLTEAALNARMSPTKCEFQNSMTAAAELLERGMRREIRGARRGGSQVLS